MIEYSHNLEINLLFVKLNSLFFYNHAISPVANFIHNSHLYLFGILSEHTCVEVEESHCVTGCKLTLHKLEKIFRYTQNDDIII
jgi:hypothetical protein